jgi:hypothetical protein
VAEGDKEPKEGEEEGVTPAADAATTPEGASQNPAEPPGHLTQLPTASQERERKPARVQPTKRKPKREDSGDIEDLPLPADKDFQEAVFSKLYEVDVGPLTWDHKCEWGQARPLDETLADHYFQQLKAGPEPRQLIRILAWQKSPSM